MVTHSTHGVGAIPRAERILVVDDEPDIRRLLARLLKSGGYHVTAAPDGPTALALAAELDPDLVLLDVSMPGMDGYAVCRALQQRERVPAVIFVSAYGTTRDRVEGLEAGAVDYVVKPFDPVEVRARARAALRTQAVRDALALQASTDPLTGLANRRQLDLRLAEAFDLAHRHGRPLACLMLDVDHFKRVNDTYGHAAGDAVLREVAARARAECRAVDTVARFGGEELTVLLPETDAEGARTVAERMRAAVAATPVPAWATDGALVAIPVRISIGIAALGPHTPTAEALRATADGALYQAKQTGRDRVVVANASDASDAADAAHAASAPSAACAASGASVTPPFSLPSAA
jgi:two-component system, cell cycle response regulator